MTQKNGKVFQNPGSNGAKPFVVVLAKLLHLYLSKSLWEAVIIIDVLGLYANVIAGLVQSAERLSFVDDLEGSFNIVFSQISKNSESHDQVASSDEECNRIILRTVVPFL